MKPNSEGRHKALETFFEVIGWIRIMLSPVIIGLVLGALVYINFENTAGLIVSLFLVVLGVFIGIYLANRAWKKNGTMFFLSRTIATPELDKKGQDMDSI